MRRTSGRTGRFTRLGGSNSRQFRTAAWALRIAFVIALVIAVWLARPQGPAAKSPESAGSESRHVERSQELAPSDAETVAESDDPSKPTDRESAERDADRSDPLAGNSFPANSNPKPAAPTNDSPIDAEIRATLERIATGGPYPFRQDDTVFLNREGRLPKKPLGYYREYTVKTPGADDRGPRRVVRGEQGELYFTEDHYRSFVPLDHTGRIEGLGTSATRPRGSMNRPPRDESGSRSR